MDARSAGTKELDDALEEFKLANHNNTCGWSDQEKMDLAKALKSLVRIKMKIDMSMEQLASYLGVSPRTVRRRVAEGLLPRGKHWGHKELSFLKDEVDEYLTKNRKKEKDI